MFKTAEDGTASFRPINSAYAMFHPSEAPGGETEPNACTLESSPESTGWPKQW
jgi:hypothetical protein